MDWNLEDKAQLSRTLVRPVRLKIAARLAVRCSCVKEIWKCLEMQQAVVSQHLKVMKESGLLLARREGVRICYSLKDDMLVELVRLLQVDVQTIRSRSLRGHNHARARRHSGRSTPFREICLTGQGERGNHRGV